VSDDKQSRNTGYGGDIGGSGGADDYMASGQIHAGLVGMTINDKIQKGPKTPQEFWKKYHDDYPVCDVTAACNIPAVLHVKRDLEWYDSCCGHAEPDEIEPVSGEPNWIDVD
jgi:hypothetical protein